MDNLRAQWICKEQVPCKSGIHTQNVTQRHSTSKFGRTHHTHVYACITSIHLFKLLTRSHTGDWDQFKEEIYDLYPGSKRENRYSTAFLQELVKKQTLITIQNAEDFGTYHRSFLKISSHLRNKSHLSDRETSLYFFEGLDQSVRDQVQDQLKAENPKHHTDEPYPLAKISTTALFVLSCNHAEFSH